MHKRKLGATGLEVSVVAMGCWAIIGGSTWGDQDESEALAAVQTALDEGINFFDTAEGYGGGESEQLLARGLGRRRDEAIIASKVSPNHLKPDDLIGACEASLKALDTDRIELYQIHWPSREVPLHDSIGALLKLQEQGKIQHWGVSNFGPHDTAELLEVLKSNDGVCASNQLIYSLLSRAIEIETLPACRAANISVLAYSPLAQGMLTGKFHSPEEMGEGRRRTRHFSSARAEVRHGQSGCEAETFAAIDAVRKIAHREEIPMGELALAWCLHQPGLTCVLAGARNPKQARSNAAAGRRSLPPELVAELDAATQTVKEKLGPSIDLWQAPEESRTR